MVALVPEQLMNASCGVSSFVRFLLPVCCFVFPTRRFDARWYMRVSVVVMSAIGEAIVSPLPAISAGSSCIVASIDRIGSASMEVVSAIKASLWPEMTTGLGAKMAFR